MSENIIVCYRCGHEVSFDNVSDGYYAYCPECDKDLYSYETWVVDPNL